MGQGDSAAIHGVLVANGQKPPTLRLLLLCFYPD
jgi:hypothetical protein